MGNKVIRLTEADIKKMVDKVLSEQRIEQRGKTQKPVNMSFNIENVFDSGEYKITNPSELNGIIKKIKDLQKKYPNNIIAANVIAGESDVPNPKGFEEKGSLAKARDKEVKKYLNSKLPNLSFAESEIVLPKIKWDPNKGKDHPDYKSEQFFNLEINIMGDPVTPETLIVPKPMYGQNASGDKTFVGFVDGSVFVFDKNNETQRELLSQFSRIPEFNNFRKSRHRLSQVCNKHHSLCDVVKYDKNNYVTVDNEEVFNQLIDKVKKEKLLFPKV